jgi:hypothetical protein
MVLTNTSFLNSKHMRQAKPKYVDTKIYLLIQTIQTIQTIQNNFYFDNLFCIAFL